MAAVAVIAQSGVVPIKRSARQPRTLGLLEFGANALSNGIGAVGGAAATAVGAVAAAKPLILLGLGKCKTLGAYLRHPSMFCRLWC